MLEIFGKSPETQGAGVEVVGRGGGGAGGGGGGGGGGQRR